MEDAFVVKFGTSILVGGKLHLCSIHNFTMFARGELRLEWHDVTIFEQGLSNVSIHDEPTFSFVVIPRQIDASNFPPFQVFYDFFEDRSQVRVRDMS